MTQHQDISGKANTADLATVATSGSYNDLTNKPTIPTNNNQLTNGAGYQTASDVSTAIATKQDTLPSGTAGQVLTLDSNLDPIWAQPSGSADNVQTTSNLVTSLSSSSTDTQYPSAKCVYDIIGNLETLLASI